MKTEILKIDYVHDNQIENLQNQSGILRGAEILRQGGLVAFPTETVYGLGANGLESNAVKKIYQAKGRPSDNPLILHIVDINELDKLVNEIPKKALKLMEKFWPGPLTLVFKKQSHIPDQVTGGLETVAVRMPSHPIARALIAAAKVPVAAPSANLSGRPSPTLAEHVITDLKGRVEMIIDGGPCQMGIESTVLDCSEDEPILLRPGSISLEDLQEVIGEVRMDVGVDAQKMDPDKEFQPKSPGMKYRHYSPKAEMMIIEGEAFKAREKLLELINNSNQKLGVLATQEMADNLKEVFNSSSVVVKILGSRDNVHQMAARLFKLLREFDEDEVDLILAEGLPLQGLGLAVMNRLSKAAGYKILRV